MLAVIRIKGQVGLRKGVEETLNRLRLKKKYSCVVLEETNENRGMVKKVKDFVAFGNINDETLKEMKEKRGQKIEGFFRLHPPRKGINTKEHFPKGALGNHGDKINELIKKML